MRTQVMGIVNVTPDSFAESAALVVNDVVDIDAAVARAYALLSAGADIIDIGGESTRPGASRISADQELARVLPVVRALSGDNITLSVDTTRADVAHACVAAGAHIINDVSGGTADPRMLSAMARSGARVVLMHRRGDSADMYAHARYTDPVTEVLAELTQRVDAAVAAGVSAENIVLDPGLGFAKQPEHNWALLQAMPTFVNCGLPVLVGASRKRFLGELLRDVEGTPRCESERDVATAAVSALCAQAGVWAVRVHDVISTVDALAVVSAMRPADRTAQRHAASNRERMHINLTGIEGFGRHGVFAFERNEGQMFVVDAAIQLAQVPRNDALGETVDYGAVASVIQNLIAGEPVNLIETLARRIASELMSRFDCREVSVTVHKPQAPIAATFRDISVTVGRAR